MGKTLILTEKPSVAREIARIMGGGQSMDGHIVGGRYIITWALGHLVTLSDPESYKEEWKEWKLESLPMIPTNMELAIIKETSKQFSIVRNLLHSPAIDDLIIATDAGREGELVARWIVEKAKFRKPMKRLWISSMTDQAIKEGFSRLKPSRDYDNLFESAKSRSIADWLVGLNATRALTCKHNASLSAGRVQTPTLAMIVEREREIKRFVPKEYFQVFAKANGILFLHFDKKTNQSRYFERKEAESVANLVRNGRMRLESTISTMKSESPPFLYDLTELQRDANRLYSFSAKKTLQLTQRLYEIHKLLTYPRTDSKHLGEDMFPTIVERIREVGFGEFGPFSRSLLKNPIKKTKRVFDSSKVTDHHAIIPTEQSVNETLLDGDEKKIYYLVVKRFLAAFMEDFTYEHLALEAICMGSHWKASGKSIRQLGWKTIYGNNMASDEEEQDDSQVLPNVKKNDEFPITNTEVKKSLTSPPKRYTEATLLTAMEHPAKFIDDERMKIIIEQASGIGTPATRADIIERIFSAGYVEQRGKEIVPTSKGIQLIDLVPTDLKSPLLTAKWEQELSRISDGKRKSEEFIREMETYASRLVESIKNAKSGYRHDNLTKSACPSCGKAMLEVSNKFGRSLVCQDRECGHRRSLSKTSNARCPICHKQLEIIGSEEKRHYSCKCGFKEKAESFQAKMEDRKKDLSKRDVDKFIKSIQNEIPAHSPFADQLELMKKKVKR